MTYTKESPLRVVTEEIWKPIQGYEGIYEVSSYGHVKSVARIVSNGLGFVNTKEKILKPNIIAKGYLQVTLCNGNHRKCFQVHRLVAGAFIPNTGNMPQVNHINGNKQDNSVSNLEWCDNSGNQKHAWRIGLQKPHYCGGGADKKKRVALLDNKGNIEKEFNSILSASKYMGCPSPANLSHLLNGKGRIKTIYGRKFKFI